MTSFPKIALTAALLAMTASPAFAHPHETVKDEKVETKKSWPNFGDKKADKTITIEKFKFEGDDAADDIREAGKMIEEALTESGVITDLADMMADLAEDFDIKDGADGMKLFLFDGKEMGHFKMDKDRNSNDRLNIGGLGQNLSLERETYVKDGKTKTRIVIEMDGGEEIDIDLPELDSKMKKKLRILKDDGED